MVTSVENARGLWALLGVAWAAARIVRETAAEPATASMPAAHRARAPRTAPGLAQHGLARPDARPKFSPIGSVE
jgi:hypothetical protein